MGLPTINIVFKKQASDAILRSKKGVVALILKDSTAGNHILTAESQIPATLSAENRAAVQRAFLGYVSKPRKVILSVVTGDTMDTALAYLATQQFDYLAGPTTCTADQAAAIKTWILAQRENGAVYKAVLPDLTADSEAIVNFAADGIIADGKTFDTASYCGRIAGLIAGTPMTRSCTFAPLPEVQDVERLTKTAMDTAIDEGKFMLYHDGTTVKVARGVNSLTTLSGEKDSQWKKIKIVELLDMIRTDIKKAAEDGFVGKYQNTYSNKCLLVTAIHEYLLELEKEGLIREGSMVSIDLAAQTAYLQEKGVDTSAMDEQDIKSANTDEQVFVAVTISPIDAIEDITVNVTLEV